MGFFSKVKPQEPPEELQIALFGLECLIANALPEPEPKVGEYNPDIDYKIIVNPIINHIVLNPTPLGTFKDGLSKVHEGFQVGVKERSPRQDYDETQDVEDLISVQEVIEKYQKKYKVEDKEVYGL